MAKMAKPISLGSPTWGVKPYKYFYKIVDKTLAQLFIELKIIHLDTD